jgi:hypothetical protein
MIHTVRTEGIFARRGQAHSAELWPNALDPQGGWRDTGITYGTNHQLFTKTIRGGADGASYVLYHSTTQGWGYFYVVGQISCFELVRSEFREKRLMRNGRQFIALATIR